MASRVNFGNEFDKLKNKPYVENDETEGKNITRPHACRSVQPRGRGAGRAKFKTWAKF